MTPRLRIKTARLGIIFGYLLVFLGVIGDERIDSSDLRALGLATIVGAALWLGIDFYENIRQCAYDDGYRDATDTVVPFPAKESRTAPRAAATNSD